MVSLETPTILAVLRIDCPEERRSRAFRRLPPLRARFLPGFLLHTLTPFPDLVRTRIALWSVLENAEAENEMDFSFSCFASRFAKALLRPQPMWMDFKPGEISSIWAGLETEAAVSCLFFWVFCAGWHFRPPP